MAKNIVVLGGSWGGISTAHNILKHTLPNLPSGYKVVLVTPSRTIFGRPAAPRALIDDSYFDQKKLFVDIPSVFAQYSKDNFEFMQGAATAVDHTTRHVSIALSDGIQQTVEFYALVVATGAQTPSPLLSLSPEETTLRARWAEIRAALPTAKTIVIAGGGPTGVETAGELGEHLNGRAGWFASTLANPKVNVTLVAKGQQILPYLPPNLAATGETLLGKVGVTVIKNAEVSSVSPEDSGTTAIATKTTVTLSSGKELEADIYIPAMGFTPNSYFMDKSFLESDGRITTNASSLRVDAAGPRIYALGDVSSAARASILNVTAQIPVLSANLKRDLLLASTNKNQAIPEDRVYKEGLKTTQLVAIGHSKGLGMANGYNLPSLMVWAMKGRDYWLWTTGNLWNGKQWSKEG